MAFDELQVTLTREQLAIRQKIANGNGLNMFYPHGRGFPHVSAGPFPSYDGIAMRVFGYTVDAVKVCVYGLIGYKGGFVMIKIGTDRKAVVIKKSDGSSDTDEKDHGSHEYEDGERFLFGVRAAYDPGIGKTALYAIEHDKVLASHPVVVAKLYYHENYNVPGSHIFLSSHVGDYEPAKFPDDTGLDPVLAGVIRMELGSFAVYEGIYKGSDPITIVSLNSVPNLGKPGSSNVTVKISIRKNLKMYVFMPDYGPRPVVAPFKELVKKGHYYIPRFSLNFSVRNAQVQIYY